MFRRNHVVLLAAGILATLAACHQANPAASVTAASYQAQQPDADRAAGQDRSAREVPGYAPVVSQPSRVRTTAAPAPAPAPAPSPQDDPMRQFDMP